MAKQRARDLSASASTPHWAINYASMLLDTGLTLPQVQDQLVALGISLPIAGSLVENLLEDRIRQRVLSQRRADRWISANRFFSGIVGCVSILGAFSLGGGSFAVEVALELCLPLACIWYGVQAAKHFASIDDDSTPSFLIRLAGWLLLVLVGLFMVLRGPFPS